MQNKASRKTMGPAKVEMPKVPAIKFDPETHLPVITDSCMGCQSVCPIISNCITVNCPPELCDPKLPDIHRTASSYFLSLIAIRK
ncbi:dihydropyrimidine dehydrogenase [NADP(+)]-like isoform X1 [Tachysurus ichikawai]